MSIAAPPPATEHFTRIARIVGIAVSAATEQDEAEDHGIDSETSHDHPLLKPSDGSVETDLRRAALLVNRYDMRRALDALSKIGRQDGLDDDTYDYIQELAERAIRNLALSGHQAEAKQFSYDFARHDLDDEPQNNMRQFALGA